MSRSKPSVLFTARNSGLPLRRASCATNWSWGVTPARPSTRTISRSASLIARSVWAIIKLSMAPAFSIRPPVSTTMQGTSVRRANPYCRSRVSPGRSATNASRVPVMALNRVDLPTFGRPINATTGSIAYRYGYGLRRGRRRGRSRRHGRIRFGGWGRGGRRRLRSRRYCTGSGSERRQGPAVGQHDDNIVSAHRRVGNPLLGCSHPGDQHAGVLVQVMYVALVIRDGDGAAQHHGSGQAAPPDFFVAPYLGAVSLTHGDDDTIRLRDEQILVIDRQAAIARHVVRPPKLPGIECQHRGAPLVPGGKHVVADHSNRRIDVVELIEFGAAVRGGQGRVPQRIAGIERHRHDLAVVESADRHILGDDRYGRAAQTQARDLLLHGPQ